MKPRHLYLSGIAVLLLLLAACGSPGSGGTATSPAASPSPDAAASPASGVITPEQLSIFGVLPAVVEPENYELTDELVDLGRLLYYEQRISISQEMSCNSCHLLDNYGVDNLQFSLGHDGQPVGRNSPTVYNAALHIAQFWDGRAADVEEQAQGPILAAGEMGMPNPEYVLYVLNTIPGYRDLFAAAFPNDAEPLTYDNVGRAIGAFERYLTTPDRFDAFQQGDLSALNEQEVRGLSEFIAVGCASCHYGPALGGMRYAVLGQVEPYPNLTDEGRFVVTGDEADRFAFKVPSLRNIEKTGPYFHDGSIATLEEATRLMAKHQLGRELTDQQVADIVAFMKALTGELPMDFIAVPEFPESGPDTPGPYEYEGGN